MGSTLLEVNALTVRYGGVCALDELDLSVEAGSFVGLIGPNGAGKTTFIDAVTGLAPARGRVLFDGIDINREDASRRARRGVARTFQSLELFEDLTVRENLLVSAERARWWSPIVELGRRVRQPAAEAAVEEALALLELESVVDELPGVLSLGQRKLVTVARALSSRPRLVLLDEPAAGLGFEESLALGRTLQRVASQGVSLVLVDHDVGLVLGVCDVIHVLEFGRLLARGTPGEIGSDEQVIRAYLGEEAGEVIGTRAAGRS